jgi:hypothetical protein
MPFSHLWLFYRYFILGCTAITLFQCVLMANAPRAYFGVTLFWTKLLSSILIGLLFHFFRNNYLYFFYNLGYTQRMLYSRALAVDLVIWLIAIIITYQLS